MEKKLSIIIAAFNAEKTLARAIESVAKQYTEGIEVIIVENGSTDNTQSIISDYAKKFDWIVMANSQKGASNARNKGLSLASGQYVTFLDSDDILTDNAIMTIYEHLLQPSDLYVYAIQMAGEKGSLSQKKQLFEYDTLLAAKEKMISNPTAYMQVCASLYSVSIIRKNNILFDTELFMSEDSDFTLRYLDCVQRIVIAESVIYFCPGDNQNSLTRQANPEKVTQMLMALNKSFQQFKTSTSYNELYYAFVQYVLMNVNVIMVRQSYNMAISQTWKQRKVSFKQVFNDVLVQESIQSLTLVDTLKKVRLWPFAFYKLKVSFVSKLMFMIRAYQNNKFEKRSGKEEVF